MTRITIHTYLKFCSFWSLYRAFHCVPECESNVLSLDNHRWTFYFMFTFFHVNKNNKGFTTGRSWRHRSPPSGTPQNLFVTQLAKMPTRVSTRHILSLQIITFCRQIKSSKFDLPPILDPNALPYMLYTDLKSVYQDEKSDWVTQRFLL